MHAGSREVHNGRINGRPSAHCTQGRQMGTETLSPPEAWTEKRPVSRQREKMLCPCLSRTNSGSHYWTQNIAEQSKGALRREPRMFCQQDRERRTCSGSEECFSKNAGCCVSTHNVHVHGLPGLAISSLMKEVYRMYAFSSASRNCIQCGRMNSA